MNLVILDFDGVVADSFDRQYRCISHLHELLGVPRPFSTKAELRAIYREPYWPDLYDALGFDTKPGRPHDAAIHDGYREFMRANEVGPVQGILPLVGELRARHDFAMASMAGRDTIDNVLESGGATDYFIAISSHDDIPRGGRENLRKPHPFVIDSVLEKIGQERLARYGKVAYVGDGPSDVGAARAAGRQHGVQVVPIGLSIEDVGFYDFERVAAEKPDEHARTVSELRKILTNL